MIFLQLMVIVSLKCSANARSNGVIKEALVPSGRLALHNFRPIFYGPCVGCALSPARHIQPISGAQLFRRTGSILLLAAPRSFALGRPGDLSHCLAVSGKVP